MGSYIKSLGIAIASVTIAIALKLLTAPLIDIDSFLIFTAVVASALSGGLRAGVFATVLATFMSSDFFLSSSQILASKTVEQNLSRLVFLIEGLTISGIIASSTSNKKFFVKTSNQPQLAFSHLNTIFESTNDLIAALDLEFRFIAFNRSYEAEFTQVYQRAPELGTSILDAVAGLPEEQAKIKKFWGRALQGESFSIVEEFGNPNLERNYYEINFYPIQNEQGQVVGACHLVRNVSDRVRAEARLYHLNQELEKRVIEKTQALEVEIQERIQIEASFRESENRFRTLADHISQFAWMADEQGAIFWYNRRWFEYIGTTLEAMQGWGWQKVHHPDYLQDVVDKFSHSIQTGEPWEDTFPLRSKDGEFRWFLSRALPIRDEQGKIVLWFGTNTDIQEIKVVQDALQESEEKFRATFDQAPVGIAHLGLDGSLQWVNQKLCEIMGYTEAELIGMTFGELTHPDDLETDLEYVRRMLANEISTYSMEKRYLRKDGSIVWANLIGSLVKEANGEPKYFVGIVEDISDRKRVEEERKQAEIALQQGEERFRSAILNAPLPIIMHSETGEVLLVNQSWTKLTGYTHEDIPTLKEWTEKAYGERQQEVLALIQEAYQQQSRAEIGEVIVNTKWGANRLWNIHSAPLGYFPDGRKASMAMAVDITERKQAENALRESEQRFRNLADSMPQIVWTANPDGTVDYYNQRVYEFEGFSQKADGTWQWEPVVHPDDEQRTIAAWMQVLETGEIYECEHRLKKVNGEFRWHLSRGVPVRNAQHQIVKWYGTATDLHSQKQYQAEREDLLQREQAARAEAEAASRMKDEFLATLSHELRTPMNAILGWAVMLRTRKFDEATTARALETIERNTRSLQQLIEDILDISRIVRGKVHLDMQPVNLVSVLESALDTVKATAEIKHIQIDRDFNSELAIANKLVWGDSTRLQQVFWNLLANAIKFTPQSGSIRVHLSVVSGASICGTSANTAQDSPPSLHLTGSPLSTSANPFIQLQITDTGIGISPEFLPYVFDRFRQADGSTTRSHGGLGLGLAIVRQLIELHGGYVQATSAGTGQGSTLTVYLPLFVAPPTKTLPPPHEEAEGKDNIHPLSGIRVLAVDDEPDARELLTVILQGCGIQVTTVASAKAALEVMQQSRPDVLISDIGMPEENGYFLLKQLRTLPPAAGGSIPAIALTAYASHEDSQKALAAGFHQHLTKPINPGELIQAIARLVSH